MRGIARCDDCLEELAHDRREFWVLKFRRIDMLDLAEGEIGGFWDPAEVCRDCAGWYSDVFEVEA